MERVNKEYTAKESKLTKDLWNIYTNEMICFKINNEMKKCNKIYY